MAISQLNGLIVKHGRITFAIITIIIIIAFVWFFTPGASGSILFRGTPDSPHNVIGEMFGKNITGQNLQDTVRNYVIVQSVQMGMEPRMDILDNISTQGAFMQAAAVAAAEHLGIAVSDAEIARAIRAIPVFQKDGKFSPELFEAYEKEKLQPAGFNAINLDNAIREQIAVTKLATMFAQPITTSGEIAEFSRRNLEKHNILTITFKADSFRKNVKPTPDDLKAYFESNKNQFMTEKVYTADVLVFPYANYAKDYKPSADAVKEFYEANKAAFSVKGKEKTLAQATAEITKQLKLQASQKAAYVEADKLRERIYHLTENAGGNENIHRAAFAQAAEEFKMKPVSTGAFTENSQKAGTFGEDPILKNLIMQLAENAVVSTPVPAANAVYVAAIMDYKPSVQSEYAAVTDKVAKAYADSKSMSLANEAMRNFSASFADPKTDRSDMKKLAGAAGAVVEEIPAFSLMAPPEKISPALLESVVQAPLHGLTQSFNTSDGVCAAYIVSRAQPEAKEISDSAANMEMFYNYMKQNSAAQTFQEWLMQNMKMNPEFAKSER